MKFYNAYAKRWGVEPEGLGTSSSYMAVYVLRDAIERAGASPKKKASFRYSKVQGFRVQRFKAVVSGHW